MRVKLIGRGKPKIGIVTCLHGNEHYGKKLFGYLDRLKLAKGSIVAVFANEEAYSAGKRFVDQDLNRSFPGVESGNSEQRLALSVLKALEGCDFVLDMHSSSTETPEFIILTKVTRFHISLIERIPVERVVIMEEGVANGRALIDHCRCGVSIEMGRHDNPEVPSRAYGLVKEAMQGLGIISGRYRDYSKKKFFLVYEIVMHGRPESYGRIRNFAAVKKNRDKFFPVLITPKKAALDNVHFLKAREVPLEQIKNYVRDDS
ncbi:succinylglutamate desuccinylase/aspartoacylase family protein [Candidatus Woesearchaeota archaeon]|nr:succinylglutamate desuccinylase/aspartoacylase family protein [Candidatus Woesearchaeota archaeon]